MHVDHGAGVVHPHVLPGAVLRGKIRAGGALHIATHPACTVVRLDPDGTRTTLAGPGEGATGSTACAFGRGPGDETALYVTTTGGVGLAGMAEPEEAKLLRLQVGRHGQTG